MPRAFSLLFADGHVYDSVKLHNSRASLRGCGDAAEEEEGRCSDCSCAPGACPPWMQAQQAKQQAAQEQAVLHASIAGAASVADA